MLDSGKIADMTGISARTIRDWRKKGIIPESEDESTVVQAILRHLENKIEQAGKNQPKRASNPSGTDELYREKVRLAQAQADKIELEIAQKEGKIVEARGVVMAWSNAIQACRAKLLSMPTRLAQKLANTSDPGQKKEMLELAIEEALAELEIDVVCFPQSDGETSSNAIA